MLFMAMPTIDDPEIGQAVPSLVLTRSDTLIRQFSGGLGRLLLLLIASISAFAVLFIFYFIARDAIPFFQLEGAREFFTGSQWYPSRAQPHFGALPIFMGSFLVTVGACTIAVPLGVAAAVCLSDVLPFHLRQIVKPIIEILAAIPSVAYGFFALVVLAPLLQSNGGLILAVGSVVVLLPLGLVTLAIISDILTAARCEAQRKLLRPLSFVIGTLPLIWILNTVFTNLYGLSVSSGTNALNVSLILGIMALPTIVSVSEDALQSAGRELREGSYALGATRAETIVRVIIPAASSGICAAVILGVMRAIGETMVVWMASGNAAQIPKPWYNFLEPVRTLTATIAGDMGEADHITGSSRYHVLFAMALALLSISFVCNLGSEWVVQRAKKKRGL